MPTSSRAACASTAPTRIFHLVTPKERPRQAEDRGSPCHVTNALAATAGALTLGVGLETVASVLSRARALSPHRMDVHSCALTQNGPDADC